MKASQIELFSFSLPLQRPLTISQRTFQFRAGLLLKLTDEDGNSGFGEISPLPPLSRETFSQAQRQTFQLIRNITGKKIPNGIEHLEGKFETWLGRYRLFSSVRFGIEMAILNLVGNRAKQPFSTFFTPRKNIVRINGLLEGGSAKVLTEAEQLFQKGFSSFKLKVGRQSRHEDAQMVEEIRKIIGNHATLRLDANRAWDLRTAIDFGKTIGTANIEYIEEPLRNPLEIKEFCKQTGLPVALDESLQLISPKKLKVNRGVRAIVIKPMVVGGFEKSLKLIRWAQKNKISAVISSSFESGVGLIALANLAATIGKERIAHGLNTQKWFKRDIMWKKLPAKGGGFRISALYQLQTKINDNLLKAITI